MKGIFVSIFILTVSISIHANDGGIGIVGGSIIPINITTVSMDYERIFITLKENYFDVEVYIELNNHENTASEPLLGFEFGSRGSLGGFNLTERINEFILMVNSDTQRFELGSREEESCQLIYTPRLNPGINTVYHKFQMPYGFGSAEGIVTYILTTGSRWRDGIIKNLEIFIRTEFNAILRFEEVLYNGYPEYTRHIVRSFETIGQSRLYYENSQTSGDKTFISEHYSLTPNGYLYKNIQDFIPNRNIEFRSLGWLSSGMHGLNLDNEFTTIHDWSRFIEDNNFRVGYRWFIRGGGWDSPSLLDWTPSEKMLEDLSVNELRILRNTLYAIRGFVFNDNFLNEYFSMQYWYFPNPNISLSDISLSNAEQQILQYIIAEENRRRL